MSESTGEGSTSRFVHRGAGGIPTQYVAMRSRSGGEEVKLNHDQLPNLFMGKVEIDPEICQVCQQPLGENGDNIHVEQSEGTLIVKHKQCPIKQE